MPRRGVRMEFGSCGKPPSPSRSRRDPERSGPVLARRNRERSISTVLAASARSRRAFAFWLGFAALGTTEQSDAENAVSPTMSRTRQICPTWTHLTRTEPAQTTTNPCKPRSFKTGRPWQPKGWKVRFLQRSVGRFRASGHGAAKAGGIGARSRARPPRRRVALLARDPVRGVRGARRGARRSQALWLAAAVRERLHVAPIEATFGGWPAPSSSRRRSSGAARRWIDPDRRVGAVRRHPRGLADRVLSRTPSLSARTTYRVRWRCRTPARPLCHG